jgi:hypothetical protein
VPKAAGGDRKSKSAKSNLSQGTDLKQGKAATGIPEKSRSRYQKLTRPAAKRSHVNGSPSGQKHHWRRLSVRTFSAFLRTLSAPRRPQAFSPPRGGEVSPVRTGEVSPLRNGQRARVIRVVGGNRLVPNCRERLDLLIQVWHTKCAC